MSEPHYTLLAALTLDGKIARYAGQVSDWTSPEDKDWLHAELDRCDVAIIGRRTYQLVAERLRERTCLVFTRSVPGVQPEHDKLIYCNPARVELTQVLKERGFYQVCVLGGPEVYTFFLQRWLIDDLYLTLEPIIFGAGLSLFTTAVPDQSYVLVSVKQLNQSGTVLLHYRRP